MIEKGLITEDEVKAIEKTARAEMKIAVEQGLASPYPPIEELYSHVLNKEVWSRSSYEYVTWLTRAAEGIRAWDRLLDALHPVDAPSTHSTSMN